MSLDLDPSDCGTLKNSHYAMAAIVEDKSKFAAPHWQTYFHMSEQSSRGMKNNIQTNKHTCMMYIELNS